MSKVKVAVVLVGSLLATGAVATAGGRLAPIAAAAQRSTHGPFEMGACDVCHDGDAHHPGRVLKASNDLCFDCHDEFRRPVRRHPAAKGTCLGCHSPHNSRKKKLLL